MSSIIKVTDIAAIKAVRPLSVAQTLSTRPLVKKEPVNPEAEGLRRQLDGLNRALGERDAEIEKLKQGQADAYQEGHDAGRQAGLKEARDNSADRLTALKKGVERALRSVEEEVRSLERLSPLLAAACIDEMLGSQNDYRDLVTAAIRRQLEQLNGDTVLKIIVSNEDFGDETQLEALNDDIRFKSAMLEASAELAAGECRIKLVLGALEVGVRQQWSQLRNALEAMAEPGGIS